MITLKEGTQTDGTNWLSPATGEARLVRLQIRTPPKSSSLPLSRIETVETASRLSTLDSRTLGGTLRSVWRTRPGRDLNDRNPMKLTGPLWTVP